MEFDGWKVSYTGGPDGDRPSGGEARGVPGAPAAGGMPPEGAKLYGWQICRARMDTNPPSLEDASNYPTFAANHAHIVQSLGLGVTAGKNLLDFDGIQFVLVVAEQVDGAIRPLPADHPLLRDLYLVVSEKLLGGEDHGMIAVLPNGRMVPFVPAAGIG